MESYKLYLKRTFALIIIFVLIIGIINYIVDPLQQYRQASRYKPYFSNERYMNPGMVKTADYDTIILGTSTSENFIPSYIDKVLGVKSLKVPYNGGTAYEFHKLLDTIVKVGKAKNIIVGLDYFSLSGNEKRVRYVGLPLYLYDDNVLNDYKYILNFNILFKEILLKLLPSNLFGINKERLNRKNPYYWWREGMASEKQVLNYWNNYVSQKTSFNIGNIRFSNLENSFSYNILPFIKKYKNIDFYIFLPPYSYLFWKDLEKKDALEKVLNFRIFLWETLKGYKNVRLYDFQINKEIILDLNNYHDIIHYSSKINKQIIVLLKKDKYLVNNMFKNNEFLLKMIKEKIEINNL